MYSKIHFGVISHRDRVEQEDSHRILHSYPDLARCERVRDTADPSSVKEKHPEMIQKTLQKRLQKS